MKFIDMQLTEPLQRAVENEGYTTPTPIQAQTIPLLLEGKDVIGIAQTGTGKTAAFVLPLLQKIGEQNSKNMKNSPKALILAPTRELAAQISKSCSTYGKYTKVRSTAIYGGVNQKPQVKALARGVDILIATPGRLFDLMEQGHIYLDTTETFVLDEADRMLDMGFIDEIKKLQPLLPKNCQRVLFSATMDKEIEKLAKALLNNPVHIGIDAEEKLKIHQELYYVSKIDKPALLQHLMSTLPQEAHTLVFTRTKAAADKVARNLRNHHTKAEAIHGDKTQAQRQKVLNLFKEKKIVLVATDVAARGIDVQGISHIINYDLPNDAENYVHRIGRTARAGAEGIAYSFCDETENNYREAIQRVTGEKLRVAKHMYHSETAQKSKQAPKGRNNRFSKGPQRSYGKRRSDNDRKPWSKKKSYEGEKKSYNKDKPRFNGEKKSYEGEKKKYNKDKPRFNGEKKSYEGAKKKSYEGEKKSYNKDKPNYDGAKKKSYSRDRPSHNEKKTYKGGEKKSYNKDRSGKRPPRN